MAKRIGLITLAVAALAAVPIGYAGVRSHFGGDGHGFGMHHRFAHGMMIGHLKDELDLTDAQAEQIKAIVNEARAQNRQYREQLHDGYKSVAQTLIANPSNVAAAQALIERQTEAERALKANIVTNVAKALAVLTPEQREKLQGKLAAHMERWENR